MYIGQKKIKETIVTDEKTPGGGDIIAITYEDGLTETFSKLMYNEIVSEEMCDLTDLRDKRVRPIVASVLLIFREWGMKVGETAYFSALLNNSLEHNKDEAQKELWRQFMPSIISLDDVDFVGIDRVLKTIKDSSVLSPYEPK
jgi:hypothetical protein